MAFAVGDELELTIDRLSYDGGRGVGRVNGFVFFVPETAPEERVLIQVTQVKKNFGNGRLVQVIHPSTSRRTPPCPIAGKCGGCVWQHISYDEQLKQKQLILSHQLKNILPPEIKILPIVPSPNEFRYRNRVQIHLESTDQSKTANFGFFAKGTNSIITTSDCLIADDRLFANLVSDSNFTLVTKQILQKLPAKQNLRARNNHSQHNNLEKIELALTDNGERAIRPLASTESEFTQVNSPLNLILKQHVVTLLKEQNQFQNIYDLYCGSGNMSFPVMDAFPEAKLTGVELNQGAIERATAKLLALPTKNNAQFITSAVHKFLKRTKTLLPNTAIILDPPRAGLEQGVIDQLLRLRPEFIIYISCALPTLARDLSKFQNYSVSSAQGFDMFPQTEYLETVVTLTRNRSHEP